MIRGHRGAPRPMAAEPPELIEQIGHDLIDDSNEPLEQAVFDYKRQHGVYPHFAYIDNATGKPTAGNEKPKLRVGETCWIYDLREWARLEVDE